MNSGQNPGHGETLPVCRDWQSMAAVDHCAAIMVTCSISWLCTTYLWLVDPCSIGSLSPDITDVINYPTACSILGSLGVLPLRVRVRLMERGWALETSFLSWLDRLRLWCFF